MNSNSDHRYEEVRCIIQMQHFMFLRLDSAKSYECFNLIDKKRKFWREKQFHEELSRFSKIFDNLDNLKENRLFKLAGRMRNKFAFHFDYNQVEKQLNFIELKGVHSLFLNHTTGNSIYTIAEKVVFIGFLEKWLKNDISDPTEADMHAFVDKCIDWNTESMKLSIEFAHQFSIHILQKYLPEKRLGKARAIWLEDELILDDENFRSPIFVRRN